MYVVVSDKKLYVFYDGKRIGTVEDFKCPNGQITDGILFNYKDFLNWWKQIISKSNCSLIAYQINQKYKDDMNQVIIDLGYELIDEIQLPKQVSHFNKKHKKTEFPIQ